MQLKHEETTGSPAPVVASVEESTPKSTPNLKSVSTTTPLSSIDGPTYATAQLLVQQVAYALSDKIFSYSPATVDLDAAARHWQSQNEPNAHGYPTTVVPLQTRTGAGSFALGYVFSADFDLSKRDVPQSLLAPSSSLRLLRGALDQLALLYNVASPFVGHVAALDYRNHQLVSDYGAALQLADELGLGLVASASAAEAQHMALLATLLAKVLPTLHVYDGLRTARETVPVTDALAASQIGAAFARLTAAPVSKRLDDAGKVLALLQAFNNELGTTYQPFEYHGHAEAEEVLVTFGSVEAQLAAQTVAQLSKTQTGGRKIGTVNVRLYRPFIEEAFLSVLPPSVRRIAIVGQVADEVAVQDATIQSALFGDVLASVSLSSSKWTRSQTPTVLDVKYAAAEALSTSFFASVAQKVSGNDAATATATASASASASAATQEFVFWDVDNSDVVDAPTEIASALAQQPTVHVSAHDVHDNLIQGGIVRTEIRAAPKAAALLATPYAVEQADVTVVGDEKLLKDVYLLAQAKPGSSLLLRLPSFKGVEDAEKRIPAGVRKDIQQRNLQLFVLDTADKEADASKKLLEQAFFQVAYPQTATETLEQSVLASVEIPAAWAELPADFVAPHLASTLQPTSFVAFDKEETEPTTATSDWQAAAKGLAFKEAYGTQTSLRPELTVKTATVTVTENRRLTPATYERNIFHIEFDLGDSGVTYDIGEALGVHADNDPVQVQEFLDFYGLDAEALVQVPSREDATVLETRTVFQSLLQNVDILGKPPKRFYEALAEFATDEAEKKTLAGLGGKEAADDFKQRSEVDTLTYVDILQEFQSAHPPIADLVRIVSPMKRREYSIASAQAVTPTAVSLMIVVVDWVDPRGRKRYGQASHYLSQLPVGAKVTVSVKPSVMKLPTSAKTPLIMAGLGTGLAPFRAFVQYRAMQKARGEEIGSILLFLGSRHQREEYLYGEEWEAYVDAGVITLLGAAFSRDQPQKIYIQDRMRQSMDAVVKAYIQEEGSFYLCGPTWPVPDLTDVLMEAISIDAKAAGRKVDPHKEIDRLKEDGRYVLEVY